MTFGLLFDVILLCFLAPAAYCDVKWRRVPNWITVIGAGWGAFGSYIARWSETGSGWPGAGFFMLRALAVCFIFSVPYLCRMIGAADIKLMAIIVGWLGTEEGAAAISVSFLSGAVLALWKMRRNHLLARRFAYLVAYIRQTIQEKEIKAYYVPERDGDEAVIPFCACLCLGTTLVILLKTWSVFSALG